MRSWMPLLMLTLPMFGAAGSPVRVDRECPSARCSCFATTASQARDHASVVVLATAIAVRNTDLALIPGIPRSRARVYRFVVASRWKGTPADTLEIWTPDNEGLCGATFSLGTRYLIFATERDGANGTDLCMPNVSAVRAASMIAELGPPLPRPDA